VSCNKQRQCMQSGKWAAIADSLTGTSYKFRKIFLYRKFTRLFMLGTKLAMPSDSFVWRAFVSVRSLRVSCAAAPWRAAALTGWTGRIGFIRLIHSFLRFCFRQTEITQEASYAMYVVASCTPHALHPARETIVRERERRRATY
jgi:hypothetical protein